MNRFASCRSAWRTIGGQRKYFRSRWEANFARYLEYLKANNHIRFWRYEPKIFWFEGIKRGTNNYLPDFKVTKLDGTHYWVEVKGYMDAKSKTKIKRMKKYFPDEELIVRGKKWFGENASKIKILCPGWE